MKLYYLAVLFFSFLITCSPLKIVKYTDIGKKDRFEIETEFISIKDDSLCIVQEKNCVNSDTVFLMNPNDKIKYNASGLYLSSMPRHLYVRYCFNSDSSLLALTTPNLSMMNGNGLNLYIIDLTKQSIIFSWEFDVNHPRIHRVGAFNSFTRDRYSYGRTVEWVDNKSFIIAATDGIYLYSYPDSPLPLLMSKQESSSNFVKIDNKVFYINSNGIHALNYVDKTEKIIVEDKNIFKIFKAPHFIYYAKGWSLYQYNLSNEESKKIYTASSDIIDVWQINSNEFIILSSDLGRSVPNYTYSHLNTNDQTSKTILQTSGDIKRELLDRNKQYFGVKYETINFKRYKILFVHNLKDRSSISVDYESIISKKSQ